MSPRAGVRSLLWLLVLGGLWLVEAQPRVDGFQAGVHPPNSYMSHKRTSRDLGPIRLIHPSGNIIPALNVYLLWYGNWTTTQRGLAEHFVRHIGRPRAHCILSHHSREIAYSPWWNILSTYYQNNIGGASREFVGSNVQLVDSRYLPLDDIRYPQPLGYQDVRIEDGSSYDYF